MFALYLVFLALLASATAQAGSPRYIQGQWLVTEESLQYDDTDRQFAGMKERLWPENSPEVVELETEQDQNPLTTPEPYALTEQDPDDDDDDDGDGEELSVWKIVLVVAVLLVSVVGSLSVAYYMCIWRGGRIHYQPQKVDYT